MTADVFAILLLFMPLAAAVVIFLAGKRPSWKSALAAAAIGSLAAYALIFLFGISHACDKGGTQAPALFAAACTTGVVAFVRRKAVVIPAVIALLLAGFFMNGLALDLVHEPEYIGYTDPPYIGFDDWQPRFHVVPAYENVREARDFIEKEFKGDRDGLIGAGWIEDVFPVVREPEPPPEFISPGGSRVSRFWHTFFTGIYKWNDVGYGIWCAGGRFEDCLESLSIRHRVISAASPDDMEQLALDADPCETFLAPMNTEWAIGKPLMFRVEVRSRAQGKVRGHSAAHQFKVVDSAGKTAPYIRSDAPSPRAFEWTLSDDGNFVFFENFDLLEAYMLPKPGRYSVQFTGRGLERNARPSNIVEIDIGDGEKPIAYRIAEKLLPHILENWRMSFGYCRSSIKARDGSEMKGAEVDLHCSTPKTFALLEIYALERKADFRSNWSESPEYLGKKDGLHFYLVAFGGHEKHWPGGTGIIRNALLR